MDVCPIIHNLARPFQMHTYVFKFKIDVQGVIHIPFVLYDATGVGRDKFNPFLCKYPHPQHIFSIDPFKTLAEFFLDWMNRSGNPQKTIAGKFARNLKTAVECNAGQIRQFVEWRKSEQLTFEIEIENEEAQ